MIALPSETVKMIHANDLRKFHARVKPVGVIFVDEQSFGSIEYYEKNLEELDQ